MDKGLAGRSHRPEVNARWARGILQGMPVLMDAFDDRGYIVVWNAECERVSGYSAAEIIDNPLAFERLYPDDEYRTFMMDQAAKRRHEDYSSVWELTAKDGTRKTVEWFNVGARLTVPGWSEWSIGIDITERRRLEIALQEATTREQRRIASEIHDGLGQELSGLSLLASGLAAEHASRDGKLAHDLRRLADLASRSVTTCRFLAQGLAPLREHQNSLVEALRGLAAESTGRAGGPKVLFSEDSSAPSLLSQEVNNQLYRIAQEALNNALKHSGAHLVQIHLCVDRLKVELRISDDGRGFGASPPILRGMGMQTMRDRAAAVGGRLSISTDGLRGTVVDCACHNRLTPVAIDKISDIHAATMR
jgi:PAS domain S-box-containing protein